METRYRCPAFVLRLFKRIFWVIVFILALELILESWGYEMRTLLAILGTVLGMVAIGFVAAWSLLSNLMCAFLLAVFRPFRIGDIIEIPSQNVAGKATDLTLLYTTLRTDEGDNLQVPNNLFFQTIYKCHKGVKTKELHEKLLQPNPAAS